ncbi:MAG: hypothetical protein AB7U20_00360 [Planctomycetaceae bacterium]
MTTSAQTRRQLLDALDELSRLRPDWRLGQTLVNLAMTAGRVDAGGVWDLEDDEALAAAKVLVEQAGAPDADAAECQKSRGMPVNLGR